MTSAAAPAAQPVEDDWGAPSQPAVLAVPGPPPSAMAAFTAPLPSPITSANVAIAAGESDWGMAAPSAPAQSDGW